jgi:hypothetical protein
MIAAGLVAGVGKSLWFEVLHVASDLAAMMPAV